MYACHVRRNHCDKRVFIWKFLESFASGFDMQIDNLLTHQLAERFYLFYIGNKYIVIKCAMINHI